jgi:hypothetical protein
VLAQSVSGLELSIVGGYGFGTRTKTSTSSIKSLQPYDLGFAARIGYAFEDGWYIGAQATMHRGQLTEVSSTNGPFTFEMRVQCFGAELGHVYSLAQYLSVRPYLGFGVGGLAGNFNPQPVSSGEGNDIQSVSAHGMRPYVSPGALLLAPVKGRIAIVLEARYTFIADYVGSNALAVLIGGHVLI